MVTVWYVAGAFTVDETMTIVSGKGTLSKDIGIPKMASNSTIQYVGHYTSMNSEGSLNVVKETDGDSDATDFVVLLGNRGSGLQYDNGYTDYLTVLDAERQLFSAELEYASALRDRLNAVVSVCMALGGGWQDQIGGYIPGAKLVTTMPGLRQTPDIRWLPETMLSELIASGRAMLYYTGVTRVARSILASIVRSIFLNNRHTLGVIGDIALNADFAADAIQRADDEALAEALRRSWALNRELDIGTLPASILPLTGVLDKYGAAYKLLGAGGGGYMLILAPDLAAAAAIRETLRREPLNNRARFVAMSLSRGLQITRS